MKKKLSVLCLLLVMTLVLGMLAGCGSSSSSTTDTTESEAEQTTTETSEEEATETEEAEKVEEADEEAVPAAEEDSNEAEAAAAESNVSGQESEDGIAGISTAGAGEGAITFPLDETVTLTYWFAPESDGLESTNSYNENLAASTAEEQTNVHIEWQEVSFMAQTEQFNLMVASNDYPDIIQGFAGNYTRGVDHAIEEEIILDLTDLMADYAPNYSYLCDNNDEIRKASTTDTGKIGSFYFLIGDADLGTRSGLWIRQDWLEELNLDVPTTYDEMHDVLTAFKNEYNTSSTLLLVDTGYFSSATLVGGYNVGVDFYNENGTIKYGFIEDGFRDYVEMMRQWYSEGLISSDFVSISEDSLMFDSTNIINSSCGVWNANYRGDDSWANSAVDESFTPLAIADMTMTGTEQIHVVGRGTNVDSAGCVVSVDCDEPEIAVAWIDWWYSEEATLLSSYGVEGLTFEYNEDGQPIYTDMVLNNDQGSVRAMRNLYTGMSLKFRVYRVVTAGYDNGYDKLDRGTWDSNRDNEWDISNYVAYTTEEGEEYNEKMSNIETYIEENIPKFIIGARDMSEWDQYVQDIKDMGIEDVIEIVTAAVARYEAR